MNSDTSKIQRLQQQQQQAQTSDAAQTQEAATEERTFETPEDLLRADAENVSPTPQVFTRLQDSMGQDAPVRPLWKRVLDKLCGT